ncbi:hypothetical protein O181_094915 [Austropuccinia psidii MF-1]|uniref:BED-type domain-containing protein n=1 Tax=Austropuccinia psidii MF-1 TaxID=1389203 RepID=A0A9Q3PBI9_9BASI|nr:hypothetical protein [Austropuccinia psidii MF-1]
MSTAPTSQTSTPCKSNQATQTTNSEPTGGHKRSWVWSFFAESNEGFVQCQVNDQAGNPCNRKLKRDRTGSTKGMSNHLNVTHRLTSSKSSNLSDKHKETLDKFIQTSVVKKVLSVETLKTDLIYFISDCDLLLSIAESPSFHRFLEICDHYGHSLANEFIKVIQQYKLEKQILCITADNASANHRMAQEIQVECPTFVSEANTIGCMAHIIHLAAHDGLKALAHANEPTQAEAQEPQGRMDLSNLIDKADGLYLKYNSIASQIARLGSYLCQSPPH